VGFFNAYGPKTRARGAIEINLEDQLSLQVGFRLRGEVDVKVDRLVDGFRAHFN
jgi:hypothetical protein